MHTQQPVEIRPASPEDAATIAVFNCNLASETEDYELPLDRVTSGVLRGMSQNHEVHYLLAEYLADSEPQAIGTLMLTREWSDWRDGWIYWIQSVYVAKPFRGQGVFKSLLSAAEEFTKEIPDAIGLRLYVENENQRAQDVYARTGFTDPNYKVLERLF